MLISKLHVWLVGALTLLVMPTEGFPQDHPTPNVGVRSTPLHGVVEASIGNKIYYASDDGNYVLVGELIDVRQRRSVTEAGREQARLRSLERVDRNDFIVFSPEGGAPQQTLFVIVSLDCSFCHRFHAELGQLLAKRFEVRYVIYAQDGDTDSWRNARAVMCSADRSAALSLAFASASTQRREFAQLVKKMERSGQQCDEAVLRRHQQLVRAIGGISITPTLVSNTGRLILGHVGYQWLVDNVAKSALIDVASFPFDELSNVLHEHAPSTKKEASSGSDVSAVN